MTMMMSRNRNKHYCICDRCSTRSYRESMRGTFRSSEDRLWRDDVRDLPQGESWLDFMLEVPSFGGVRTEKLSYWEAMDHIEEIHEDYPPPEDFSGVWSTGPRS